MPRQIPDCPTNISIPKRRESRSYEIELITPMVGGGAVAGEVDIDFPIRPTAIRGHLRYWWRLIRGHSLGERMWRREEEIFGSTEFPSPVTVVVNPGEKKAERYLISDIQLTSTLGYAVFPSIKKRQDLLKHGYKFSLDVTTCTTDELLKRRISQNGKRKSTEQLPLLIEPIHDELEKTLKAWMLFGGLGARTRRGCGSLRLHSSNSHPVLNDILMLMPKDFQVFQSGSTMKHFDAWEQVLELFKKFRQQIPGGHGMSRKKFPEAETLRRISKIRKRGTKPIADKDLPNGFPRAEFGLPIVFQFKDRSGPDGATALPSGFDSKGDRFQRMSSPIIIKPIPVSETESKPSIIVVRRPIELSVDILNNNNILMAKNQFVVDPQFAAYSDSPLAETSGSAIDAFIKFTGFIEVKR